MRSITIALLLAVAATAYADDRAQLLPPFDFGIPVVQTVVAADCDISSLVWPFVTGDGVWLNFTCAETHWFVMARNSNRGLIVGPVYLQRSPGEAGIQIPKMANIAEIFTPYHTGNPDHRLSDTVHCTVDNATATFDPSDVGSNAILIKPAVPASASKPTIAAEIRDRGIAWLCKSPNGSKSRRGAEMVLWGIWDTGNYEYLIEYTFRDDGQISFRVGATGYNNPGIGTDVAHMHDVLWHIDIDLGTGLNTPYVWSHYEASLPAFDSEILFNNGREGAMDLDPLHFSTLVVEDQTLNKPGNHIGYEFQPFRTGTARHYGPGEDWTLHDTWVTRYSEAELTVAMNGPESLWSPPDKYLVGDKDNLFGVFNQEKVVGQDIVVWHLASAHHDPHDEDQAAGDNGHKGITLIHWSGFDLVPHNLFDANPLGAPHRKICDGGD